MEFVLVTVVLGKSSKTSLDAPLDHDEARARPSPRRSSRPPDAVGRSASQRAPEGADEMDGSPPGCEPCGPSLRNRFRAARVQSVRIQICTARNTRRAMTEKKTHRREKMTQRTFGFTRRGGKRKGAGRKPNEEKAGVSHSARPRLSRHHPVHVTLRLRRGLPSLRHKVPYRALKRVFGACERFGFRLLHYSAQTNHIHCLCEAVDGRALSRGVQGLAVRQARALNKLWKRAGKAFAGSAFIRTSCERPRRCARPCSTSCRTRAIMESG